MSLERRLKQRSDSKCELCASEENLQVYEVPKSPKGDMEGSILLCNSCLNQIENPESVDPNHWRCLNELVHRDSNGVVLQAGDNVVLIKDLKVKGSSMVAKQGTAVRRISLDHENAEYIEGKVDGQQIVIITQYVKKI